MRQPSLTGREARRRSPVDLPPARSPVLSPALVRAPSEPARPARVAALFWSIFFSPPPSMAATSLRLRRCASMRPAAPFYAPACSTFAFSLSLSPTLATQRAGSPVAPGAQTDSLAPTSPAVKKHFRRRASLDAAPANYQRGRLVLRCAALARIGMFDDDGHSSESPCVEGFVRS